MWPTTVCVAGHHAVERVRDLLDEGPRLIETKVAGRQRRLAGQALDEPTLGRRADAAHGLQAGRLPLPHGTRRASGLRARAAISSIRFGATPR